jgi:hypothetical protein
MTLIGGQPSDEEIAERKAEGYVMALTPDGRVVWVWPTTRPMTRRRSTGSRRRYLPALT